MPPKSQERKPVSRAKKGTVSGGAVARVSRSTSQQSALEDVPDDVPDAVPVSSLQVAETPDRLNPPEPKSGPPSVSDWQDFFARYVVKGVVNGYVAMRLSDVLDELSPHEMKQIMLSKEDMSEIAAPLATLSSKSSYMKKHGRFIIATADSFESLVNLGFWMRRVNKIAAKHRKAKQPAQPTPGIANSGRNENAQHNGSDLGQGEELGRPRVAVFNPNSY
jgi:hypothetical protein